jgi:hypothetical protein
MDTLKSNIKRLVATDKKFHEAPVFIAPKEDQRTKKPIDYASRLSEAQRAELSISLEPKRDRDDNVVDEMSIRISHLQVFDLSNANDALVFEVVRDDSMIAACKADVNPLVHRYYIEDKEKEATTVIAKSKLKSKAFAVIANLSTKEMENYAKVLGKFLDGLSGGQIESALYELADATPQLILDVNNDKDLKYKIFLRRCIEKFYLHMDNGKYMNGKDLVGINEDYAIQWLKDPSNASIVSQWGAMLENKPTYEPNVEIGFDMTGNEAENVLDDEAPKRNTSDKGNSKK